MKFFVYIEGSSHKNAVGKLKKTWCLLGVKYTEISYLAIRGMELRK